jgi:hypothetical protein
MDLGLEITRTHGRAVKELFPVVVRELTATDLGLLSTERGIQKPIANLKRLSERHKNVARLVARGYTNCQVALMTGYTEATVSNLKHDPAFQELQSIYSREVDIDFATADEKLVGIFHDSMDQLRDKLDASAEEEDEKEKLSVSQLLEISKFAADRSGHGPQTKSTNVNVNVGIAERLTAARQRVIDRSAQVLEPIEQGKLSNG